LTKSAIIDPNVLPYRQHSTTAEFVRHRKTWGKRLRFIEAIQKNNVMGLLTWPKSFRMNGITGSTGR
jgi:hypothetical protein